MNPQAVFEREMAALEDQLEAGDITRDEFEQEGRALEREFREMVEQDAEDAADEARQRYYGGY